MATFQETMESYGYIRQTTPAGRMIMVNPNFYPMSVDELAAEDDYADDGWYEEEYYESRNAEPERFEDLGYDDCGQPHSDDIDWGMSTYDDRFELED